MLIANNISITDKHKESDNIYTNGWAGGVRHIPVPTVYLRAESHSIFTTRSVVPSLFERFLWMPWMAVFCALCRSPSSAESTESERILREGSVARMRYGFDVTSDSNNCFTRLRNWSEKVSIGCGDRSFSESLNAWISSSDERRLIDAVIDGMDSHFKRIQNSMRFRTTCAPIIEMSACVMSVTPNARLSPFADVTFWMQILLQTNWWLY